MMARQATCDAVVIGAGYCGLSAAIELARQGASVRVLDAGQWGGNASAYNFGSVAVMPPALPATAHGEHDPAKRLQAALAPVRALREQIQAFGYDCAWTQPGHITLALDDASAAALRQRGLEAQALLGAGVRWLDARQVGEQTRAQGVVGGLLNEHFALIEPARLLLALRNHAEALGVRLQYASPVLALEPGADTVDLVLAPGRISTARVLIASEQAWSLSAAAAREPLVLYQTHLFESAPLTRTALQLVTQQPRVYGTASADKDYFRVHQGRLLFGSRLGLLPLDAEPQAVVSGLRSRLASYFPALADVEVRQTWSGKLGFTPDGLPRTGHKGPVSWGGGYCGSGIATAVSCGRQLARLALTDTMPVPSAGEGQAPRC